MGFGYVGTPEQVYGWLMEAMEILEPLGAESPQDTARRVKSDAQNWRNSLPDRGRVITNEHYAELIENARSAAHPMEFNTLIPNHELEVLREKARKWDNITDERITFIAWRTAEQWEQFKKDAEFGAELRERCIAHGVKGDASPEFITNLGLGVYRLAKANAEKHPNPLDLISDEESSDG